MRMQFLIKVFFRFRITAEDLEILLIIFCATLIDSKKRVRFQHVLITHLHIQILQWKRVLFLLMIPFIKSIVL